MASRTLLALCAALAAFGGGALAIAEHLEETSYVPYDHKAIQYFQTVPTEPVRHLDDLLDKGAAKLAFEPGGLGYLPDLLKQLKINVDSQVLVFSQSSFQASLISPQRPRALYFNDEIAVGFVQHGEVMEVTSLDPKLGVVFYTLNTGKVAKPGFARRQVCLQCHQGGQTLGIPGMVVSSQYVPKGAPTEHTRGGFVTDDRTPLEDRWGGWYVSGTFGGTSESTEPKHRGVMIGPDIEPKFDTSPYLSPISDVVALLTLEHQTRMTNLIARIGWDTRIAIADGKLEASREKLDAAIDDMVGYMLFADEAPLPEPVKGVSTFSTTFPQRGPRDKQGRSLRDFDLEKRLFKYPLSYMIYTRAFDSLPDWSRDRIYRKLHDVLTGKNQDPKFARLSPDDRRNVSEILRDTKQNLPVWWKSAPPQ